MKRMRSILLFLFLASALADTKNDNLKLSNYGFYCGLGNSSAYGLIPIDTFGRICKIHDICVDTIINITSKLNDIEKINSELTKKNLILLEENQDLKTKAKDGVRLLIAMTILIFILLLAQIDYT